MTKSRTYVNLLMNMDFFVLSAVPIKCPHHNLSRLPDVLKAILGTNHHLFRPLFVSMFGPTGIYTGPPKGSTDIC